MWRILSGRLAAALTAAIALSPSSGPIAAAAPRGGSVLVPAGYFLNPFPTGGAGAKTKVKPFRLDIRPVTVPEYLAFVKGHPEWGRSRVKRLFADTAYLAGWTGDSEPFPGASNRAVTQVSWFAAKAYCAARGARLPSTAEWERAASQVPPGMDSAAYAARILGWYGRPTTADSAPGRLRGARHAFALEDLVGSVWEWTSDFNAAGPADRGEVSARDASFFCGGAAGTAAPGTGYATFMRYAFRGSLQPEFSLSSLGFRCAQDP